MALASLAAPARVRSPGAGPGKTDRLSRNLGVQPFRAVRMMRDAAGVEILGLKPERVSSLV